MKMKFGIKKEDKIIKKEIEKKEKDKEPATKRATKEFLVPVMIKGYEGKVGDFKVYQSKQDGNRVVSLSVDLPEKLADVLKADIAAAIARISGSAGES